MKNIFKVIYCNPAKTVTENINGKNTHRILLLGEKAAKQKYGAQISFQIPIIVGRLAKNMYGFSEKLNKALFLVK